MWEGKIRLKIIWPIVIIIMGNFLAYSCIAMFIWYIAIHLLLTGT